MSFASESVPERSPRFVLGITAASLLFAGLVGCSDTEPEEAKSVTVGDTTRAAPTLGGVDVGILEDPTRYTPNTAAADSIAAENAKRAAQQLLAATLDSALKLEGVALVDAFDPQPDEMVQSAVLQLLNRADRVLRTWDSRLEEPDAVEWFEETTKVRAALTGQQLAALFDITGVNAQSATIDLSPSRALTFASQLDSQISVPRFAALVDSMPPISLGAERSEAGWKLRLPDFLLQMNQAELSASLLMIDVDLDTLRDEVRTMPVSDLGQRNPFAVHFQLITRLMTDIGGSAAPAGVDNAAASDTGGFRDE